MPDASYKEVATHHSETDFEVLRLAISQLRAERHAQQQKLIDTQAQLYLKSLAKRPPDAGRTGSGHRAPGAAESAKVTRDSKAAAVTLEMIHSKLEQVEVEEGRQYGVEAVGGRLGGSQEGGEVAGDHRDGTSLTLGGHGDPGNGKTSTSSSNQSSASVTGPGTQTSSTGDGREKANQQGEPVFPKAAQHPAASCSTPACPVGGHRLRLVQEFVYRFDL